MSTTLKKKETRHYYIQKSPVDLTFVYELWFEHWFTLHKRSERKPKHISRAIIVI
jgi:hypothetical protein